MPRILLVTGVQLAPIVDALFGRSRYQYIHLVIYFLGQLSFQHF